MPPDFSKWTVDTLSKRASLQCSNPSCRVGTTGPAEADDVVTSIGSAAHIHGARAGSKRFRADLTERQRAELHNGIWVCRNCHAQIDSDEVKYPAALLFKWRRLHEKYVRNKLGRRGNFSVLEFSDDQLQEFATDTERANRILRDRPMGWEHRLTAELLTTYLKEPLRRWRDLSGGLYTKPNIVLKSDYYIDWFREQMSASSALVGPFQKLITNELARCWGPPAVPGDPLEIKHVCALIAEATTRGVQWEEQVQFVSVPEAFIELHRHLPGLFGSQIVKLDGIPGILNDLVDWAELNPDQQRVFEHTIVFEITDERAAKIELEINKLKFADAA
jgi:hypothetical protein